MFVNESTGRPTRRTLAGSSGSLGIEDHGGPILSDPQYADKRVGEHDGVDGRLLSNVMLLLKSLYHLPEK